MAEALFEDRLVKGYPQLFPMVRMDSAGTMGIEGNRVTETSVQTMDLWGIDLSRHRAQPLDIRMSEEADLILTMAREHLLSIERLGGKYLGKAYSLKYLASRREAALDRLGTAPVRDEGELDRRMEQLKTWLAAERGRGSSWDTEMLTFDIIDPIGGSLETYLTVAEDINAALEDVMPILFGKPEV
jgi:protein-tyrosine-phosphatase